MCVYIHKQALSLPVGQDVSVAFRRSTDTKSTAELNSDIPVKKKNKKKQENLCRSTSKPEVTDEENGGRTC